MLTGKVHSSECIHMASTNKQYNTISTLWLHREMWKEQGGEEDNPKQAGRGVKQMELAFRQIHFSKLCKERKEILTHTHSQTNTLGINSNICTHSPLWTFLLTSI